MWIEISVAVIAIAVVALVIALIMSSYRMRKLISMLQTDVHHLSQEAMQLLKSMDEFVRSDLHGISGEVTGLVETLTDLSSDVKQKSQSLNFLFKPMSFLSSRLSATSLNEGQSSGNTTIPQVFKWVASTALLIKKTQEFIKNHEK